MVSWSSGRGLQSADHSVALLTVSSLAVLWETPERERSSGTLRGRSDLKMHLCLGGSSLANFWQQMSCKIQVKDGRFVHVHQS